MLRVLFIVIGYLFGLIQTGFFYGKKKGVDLRTQGSGNTGATNAFRVFGVKGGLFVFLVDFLKAFIPCFLVRMFVMRDDPVSYVYMIYTALGVILGNDFPFYLRFKGGKGVAATSGWMLAFHLPSWGIGMGIFAVVVLLTHYVSLGSIISCLSAIALAGLFVFTSLWTVGVPTPFPTPFAVEFFIIAAALQILIVFRHRANIRRLMAGTENKLGKKKSAEANA